MPDLAWEPRLSRVPQGRSSVRLGAPVAMLHVIFDRVEHAAGEGLGDSLPNTPAFDQRISTRADEHVPAVVRDPLRTVGK